MVILRCANEFSFVECKRLIFFVRLVLAFATLMVASMEPVQANAGVPRHVVDAEGAFVISPIFTVQAIGGAAKQDCSATHIRTAILTVWKWSGPGGDAVGISGSAFVVRTYSCRFAFRTWRICGDCFAQGAGCSSQGQHREENSLHTAHHAPAFSRRALD